MGGSIVCTRQSDRLARKEWVNGAADDDDDDDRAELWSVAR